MIKTFISNAVISEFQLVKVDNAGKVGPCSASTDFAIGVAQRSVGANEPIEVIIEGQTKAIAGGNLAAGTNHLLQSDAAGKCVAYAAGDAGTQVIVGRFIPSDEAESASNGQYIDIVFAPVLGA